MNRETCEAKRWTVTHHVSFSQMIHTKGYIEWNREDRGMSEQTDPKKQTTTKVYTMDTNHDLTNNSNL